MLRVHDLGVSLVNRLVAAPKLLLTRLDGCLFKLFDLLERRWGYIGQLRYLFRRAGSGTSG